jgi:tetratricopeptide (TPR) repeat protein
MPFLFLSNAFSEKKSSQETIQNLQNDIEKTQKSIKETEHFLKEETNQENRRSLLFKLAELYVEKSRTFYFKELEKNIQSKTFLSGSSASEVELFKKKAIDIYDMLLNDYPNDEKNPEILFLKAHEYREMGSWEKMKSVYENLITSYPSDPFSNEARLVLVNYFLDRDIVQKSEDYIKEILQQSNGHMHAEALYKLALIRKDQENFQESFSILNNIAQKYTDDAHLNIKRDAIYTIASFYSEIMDLKKSIPYFYNISKDKKIFIESLYKLSKHYTVKDLFYEKAYVLRTVIQTSNDRKKNIDNVIECYNAMISLKKDDFRWEEWASEDAKNMIFSLQYYLYENNISDDEKKNISLNIEEKSRDLITKLHERIKTTKNTKLYAGLIEAYQSYIDYFNKNENFIPMKKNLAYALFENNDYINSAKTFDELTKTDDDQEKNHLKIAIESYYNAFLAHHEAVQKKDSKNILSILDIEQSKKRIHHLFTYYYEKWPLDNFIQDAMFYTAQSFYISSDFNASEKLFESFIEKYPNNKNLYKSVMAFFDILQKQNNFSKISSFSKKLLEQKIIQDESLKKEISQISKYASEKDTQYILLSNPGSNYAEAMQKQYEKNKGSKEGEEYLWKAFVKYRNEENASLTIDIGTQLIFAYPNSQRIPEIMVHMALMATKSLDLERSAFLYYDFYQKYPKNPSSFDYLKNSYEMYLFQDNISKALDILYETIENGSRDMRIWAYEKLFSLSLQKDDLALLEKSSDASLQDYATWPSALFYKGYSLFKKNEFEKAKTFFTSSYKQKNMTDEDDRIQEKSRFYLLRIHAMDYFFISNKNISFDESVFQNKANLFSELESSYKKFLQSKNADIVIFSLYELGRIYEEFAIFLKNYPVPQGLEGQEKNQYIQSVQEQYEGFFQKYNTFFKTCSTKGREFKIWSDEVALCNKKSDFLSQSFFSMNKIFPKSGLSFEEASKLHAAISSNTDDIKSMYDLALLHAQEKSWSSAEFICNTVIEKDESFYQAYNIIGISLWRKKSYEEAERFFLQGASKQSSASAMNLAYMYEQFGYYTEKEKFISLAKKWNSSYSTIELIPSGF